MLILAAAVVALASAGVAGAQLPSPALLRDLDPAFVPVDSDPAFVGRVGGRALFLAHEAAGFALWGSDATAAGTHRVTEPGALLRAFSAFDALSASDRVYFLGFPPVGGETVFVTDGTAAGTRAVTAPLPAGPLELLGTLGARAVFGVRSAPAELWVTDGTNAGTQRLATTGGAGWGARLVHGGRLYAFARDSAGFYELWTSDGTPAGTRRLVNRHAPGGPLEVLAFVAAGGSLYFTGERNDSGREPWRVDLARGDYDLLADLAPGGASSAAQGYAELGGRVAFVALGELWTTDGSAAGTGQVLDLNGDPTGGSIDQPLLVPLGGRLVFAGRRPDVGAELFVTDGTPAGTTLFRDFAPGPADGNPVLETLADARAAVAGTSVVVQVANPATQRTDLWLSDGTAAGTRRVFLQTSDTGSTALVDADASRLLFLAGSREQPALHRLDLATGVATSANVPLTRVESPRTPGSILLGDRLLFAGLTAAEGAEPWVSDGSTAGTRLLRDIGAQTVGASSEPGEYVALGALSIFVASDGVAGRELWRTDGTVAGTFRLRDIAPGAGGSDPTGLVRGGEHVWFSADDGTSGRELWRTDGTAAGTQQVADIQPGGSATVLEEPSGAIACLGPRTAVLGGIFYFVAGESAAGRELWRTDGTPAGTRRVLDLRPGPADAGICDFGVVGTTLLFAADRGDGAGRELWRSDGTESGTQRVADLDPAGSSNPGNFMGYRGAVYFAASDAAAGRELWRSDGTAAGTQRVADLASGDRSASPVPLGVAGDRLVFGFVAGELALAPGGTSALYRTDGTAAGTELLLEGVGVATRAPRAVLGAQLLFPCALPGDRVGPCATDGTRAGTRLVRDLSAASPSGPTTSLPGDFVAAGAFVWFGLWSAQTGYEPWRTDGTADGTVPLAEIRPGAPSGLGAQNRRPPFVGAAGARPVFTGDGGATGIELWTIDRIPPRAVNDTGTVEANAAVLLDVAANDVPGDGAPVATTIAVTAAPSGGAASVEAGRIRYTPRAGFTGTDTFAYTIADDRGLRSNAATVVVTVTAPPAPPPPPPPPPASGGGGGGGSLGPFALLAFAIVAALRGSRRAARGARRAAG